MTALRQSAIRELERLPEDKIIPIVPLNWGCLETNSQAAAAKQASEVFMS
ncbi:MAG: hypothetical protein HFI25_10675 [Lachnospiraceae bacterium]|nr:hypothetical protein [Lachnospiraceae bacterium]